MKTLKRSIKATPNHRLRTFTIRTYWSELLCSKFRTVPLSKEEFQSCLNNTENDWNQFLKSGNDYFKA